MQNFSRRTLFGGLVLAAGLGTALTAATVTPALADEIIITREPPPLRREVIPVLPRERAEMEVWQPGHWRWNGHEHVWVEGHYAVRPRHGAVWVPAHYDRRPGGWIYVEGHWN
jgi:hypothetical protein